MNLLILTLSFSETNLNDFSDFFGIKVLFSKGCDWEHGHPGRIIPCEVRKIISAIENYSTSQLPLQNY